MIPAKASSKHLLRLIRALEAARPGGETELAPIWHDLAGHQFRRRGLVVILSDCFDDVESLLGGLQRGLAIPGAGVFDLRAGTPMPAPPDSAEHPQSRSSTDESCDVTSGQSNA